MDDEGDAEAFDPLFGGGGLLGAVMARHDWAATPVGPPSTWAAEPPQRRRILLTSRFAMWMGWGPELTFFYNDAYARDDAAAQAPVGARPPAARGVGGDLARDRAADRDGPAHRRRHLGRERCCSFLERSGYPEETYHTFSYSPLRDDDGRVAGMLCVVTEETERVHRRAPPRAAARARPRRLASSADDRRGLDRRRRRRWPATRVDLPFALIYLLDDDERRRAVAARSASRALTRRDTRWRRRRWPPGRRSAARTVEHAVVVDDLGGRFAYLPRRAVGPSRPSSAAVVLPLAQPGQTRPRRRVRRRAQPATARSTRLPRLPRAARRPDRGRAGECARRTRRSAGAPRRWPSSTARRRRSSPTSATSSARRSR